MGNLLTCKRSFIWADLKANRGSDVENFTLAINQARQARDSIFVPPDLYNSGTMWWVLIENLFQLDYAGFLELYPWISQTQYQSLFSIISTLSVITPGKAESVQELNDEFPAQNNGWIGFLYQCREHLVHDIPTWEGFHRRFVSTFDFAQQCQQRVYFLRFYKAALRIPLNQIAQLILKNNPNNFIERIDPPKSAYDKEHVHFNDSLKSALNIDGTWRHRHCSIPNQVKEILSSWGFLLPPEYYTL